MVPIILLFGVAALGGGHGSAVPFWIGLAYLVFSWVLGFAGLIYGSLATLGGSRPIWFYLQVFFLALPIIGFFVVDYLPI